ncbi:MAG: hypothetical protein ACTFAL_01055 [Candidatus Electronema sp. V4]|uniref:hypothetical protein n=1 Tax=Candidatus Electronema sp. V4 TaxID=3454756 RepID=UPI0040559A17
MNRNKELLKRFRQIEEYFRSSTELLEWLKSKDCTPDEKAKWSDLMLDVIILRGRLESEEIRILADEFDKLTPSLDDGIQDLKEKVKKKEKFIKALDTLGNVLGMIGKVTAAIV